ncbi:hypothetical protein L915_00751, partial [Phytophthora nicotianae]
MVATAEVDPGLVALGWVDNKPGYFLASHVSTAITSINRREKDGSISTVVCPKLVREYQ